MEAKRGLRGFTPEDDRTFFTSDLNREELKILFDGIRRHRIKQTRLRLNASKEKRKDSAICHSRATLQDACRFCGANPRKRSDNK